MHLPCRSSADNHKGENYVASILDIFGLPWSEYLKRSLKDLRRRKEERKKKQGQA